MFVSDGMRSRVRWREGFYLDRQGQVKDEEMEEAIAIAHAEAEMRCTHCAR